MRRGTWPGVPWQGWRNDKVIAFDEVDHVDPVSRSGWSVRTAGRARQLDDPYLNAPASKDLHSLPAAVPHTVHLIRLRTDRLSGRSGNR